MGFPADTWKKKAGVLSGGEQTRLRLARLLLERPDILILDEPTNHLDLETMDWLETYLKAYRGAVLVVSHDRYFLDSVCTRIWELRGKTITTYRGNYSAYLPQREAADERLQNSMMPMWKRRPSCRIILTATWCALPPPKWPRAAADSWKSWKSPKHPRRKPTS